MYVPVIVGNIFGLQLLHATQQNCCVLRSRRLHPLSTSFSLKYIPILVGNRCSLRGLHATQHNCCVLESRRLHPPKHKISLRLSCCSKCWQLIAPPIVFALDKCFRSREHRYEDITPPSTKTVPGSATPRHPVELPCAAMGDSTLISNRAPDWYMSTSVCSISIIVGNRCSLRGLHTTNITAVCWNPGDSTLPSTNSAFDSLSISISDLGNIDMIRGHHTPVHKNRPGQRDSTPPSRTAVCCDGRLHPHQQPSPRLVYVDECVSYFHNCWQQVQPPRAPRNPT